MSIDFSQIINLAPNEELLYIVEKLPTATNKITAKIKTTQPVFLFDLNNLINKIIDIATIIPTQAP